ncbi:MAG: hypothetical protein R3335_04705 [Anaerolineales bacterium]|nr:hypothetical protein [Anaerolineales bacterium]
MDIRSKLNLALDRAGYPQPGGDAGFRQLGMGAWHDAYRVQPPGSSPLVIRLRKPVIYGRTEEWDPDGLHEDYAPVGLYYQEANRVRPGICPAEYSYRIDPDLVFTIESYLPGSPLPLQSLTPGTAVQLGEDIGKFFRALHDRPAPIHGHGLLVWGGGEITAEFQTPPAEIWNGRYSRAWDQLAQLEASIPNIDFPALMEKLEQVVISRKHAAAPVSLVNQDITPENLLQQQALWVGLVDPVPALDNGTYYAAWFTHCYRLFLPSLNDAPRYARHQFGTHQEALRCIADGFEAGYTQNGPQAIRDLRMDEYLWALDLAAECLALLSDGLNGEMRLRRGSKEDVNAALEAAIRTLELCSW